MPEIGFMKLRLKETIEELLAVNGESLSSAAKNTKIPQSVLHSWSTGVAPAGKNLVQIKKLADYWNVSISHLLFGLDENTNPTSTTLFSSTFLDGKDRYRLVVQKISTKDTTS